MGFNLKRAKVEYEHEDAMLEDNREEKGHKPPKDGTYEKNLSNNREEKDPDAIWEKTLSKHHSEESDKPRVTEARLDDAKKRDDRMQKTNTLPINELAEEAQRARMKARGEKGLDDSHFQQYKKEDIGLSEANFARLDGIVRQIDKLWMASSWDRLTTSEKKQMRTLMASRDQIIRS